MTPASNEPHDRNAMVTQSMLRAGVPHSMARPDFSMAAEFGKPGEFMRDWCRKAGAFFAEGRVLYMGAMTKEDAAPVSRMQYAVARALILNRISCRVVPLSMIVNHLLLRENEAALGEIEELDVLILPDFYTLNRQPPFSAENLSRLEGWLFQQVCRKGQGLVMVSEAPTINACDWWSRWLLAALEDRATSITLLNKGTGYDIR